MIISPPFFENEDNNHCLHRSVQMVFEALGKTLGNGEIDQLMEYDPSLWTWTVKAANVLQKEFPGTQFMSIIDYSEFAAKGETYLKSIWETRRIFKIKQDVHLIIF